MVIAIQKGLEGIKKKLAERGYKTVYYDEYHHPIDAYIFVGYSTAVDNCMGANALMGVSAINHGEESRSSGVLMINAANKHFAEIERLLRTRYHHGYLH